MPESIPLAAPEPVFPRASRRAALRALGLGAGTGAALVAGAGRAWQATPPVATPTAPPVTPPLFFDLAAAPPVTFASGATVQFARASEFPPLIGLSTATFSVAADTTREMHWHNNAGELGWCLDGVGAMVILDATGVPISFPLAPGTVFFAPQGLPHAFWPTTAAPLQILLGFDHPQPTTIDFSQLMAALPPPVLAQTAGLPEASVPAFPAVDRRFAAPVPGGTAALPDPAADLLAARFATVIGDVIPRTGAGGAARLVNSATIGELTGIVTTDLSLDPGATRTPHWHFAAHELCIVLTGDVEVGIIGAAGGPQSQTLGPGEIAFVPINVLHYLRNTGVTAARVILFHTGLDPAAVELGRSLDAFPAAVLAASYGLAPSAITALATGADFFIAAPAE